MMFMSPARRDAAKKTADKKRLKSVNPRTRSTGGVRTGRSSGGKPRIDAVTAVLALVALVLVVLVILMMDRRTVGGVFPAPDSPAAVDGGNPVIERVANEAAPPEEPVVELGVPENPPVETDSSDKEDPETPAAGGDTTVRLFFVKVSDEGKIGTKSVLRNIPSSGSPLTAAVNALMEGPRPGELSNDVLSLVPEEAVLIGARVEAGVAFLDFNEAFRFNALGIEGYRAQVEQIVYTATEFSTVEKVQFLIEGQRIDFLGGEGFWVGGPLGREDF